jgi:hypothetical protein
MSIMVGYQLGVQESRAIVVVEGRGWQHAKGVVEAARRQLVARLVLDGRRCRGRGRVIWVVAQTGRRGGRSGRRDGCVCWRLIRGVGGVGIVGWLLLLLLLRVVGGGLAGASGA